jgi:hypothetical protein
MYKDKEQQRMANRISKQRSRQGMTEKGMTLEGMTQGNVIPEEKGKILPANFGLEDCDCRHCRWNRDGGSKHIINHGRYKTAKELRVNEFNRVSLPGDVDYVGVAKL